MITSDRPPAVGLGQAAGNPESTTETSEAIDDAYWQGFTDGRLSGREDDLTEGFLSGERTTWDRAFATTVSISDCGGTDPRTPYIPRPRTATETVYKTRAKTPAQILARARWSWDRVERQIQAQRVGDVA